MKEVFKGFYTPSDHDIKKSWSDDKTLFVFDTNVLLNLYRYTETTRDDFFRIIDNISDKVWLPYHVGLEYQKNRLTVIKNEKAIFNNLHAYLTNLEKNIETTNLQELKLNQRLPELDKKTKKMQDSINELIVKHKKEIDDWNSKQPDVRSSDKIRKKIDKVFDKKIGSAPENQKWLDNLYEDGKKRYELNVPPGYMDKKEKEDKSNYIYANLEYVPMYGDLIIWKQVIDKVKDEEIDSLIFITDDVKEDWWYILNSNGKKEIGARAELRDEIYNTSNITSFELLRTTDFMKNGQKILELSVKNESINEAKINFENKQKIYSLKMNKDITDKLNELTKQNQTSISETINKLTRDYVENNKYENEFNINNKWLDMIEKDKRVTKDLQDKLDAFDQPIMSDKYLSLIKQLKQNELSTKNLEIERILKKLKKLDDD